MVREFHRGPFASLLFSATGTQLHSLFTPLWQKRVLLALSLGWLLSAPTAHAQAEIPLTVWGSLRVENQVDVSSSGARWTGQVLDELGQALGPAELLLNSASLSPCDAPAGTTALSSLTSDAQGRFCAELHPPLPDTLSFQVRAPHHESYSGRLTLQQVVSAPPEILRAPRSLLRTDFLSLDVLLPERGGDSSSQTLALRVICENESSVVQRQSVRPGEIGHFEIPGETLPGPGPCQIQAEHEEAALSSTPQPLEIQDRVQLEQLDFTRRASEAQLRLRVLAQQKPVTSGLVELTDDTGQFLLSAEVNNGLAQALLPLPLPRSLRALYRPASTYLLPGDSLELQLPTTAPSRWRWLIHGFFLMLAGAWLLHRARSRPAPLPEPASNAPPGQAQIQVQGQSAHGIQGQVCDAHTGEALPHAKISLFTVSATEKTPLESTSSDAQGHFFFEQNLGSELKLRILIESATHLPLESPLPGSKLCVHVTERRRAGLLRLLRWSQAGRFDSTRAALLTPAQIRRQLETNQQTEQAEWVRQVESLIYDAPTPSSEEIERLSPPSPPPH